MKEMKIIKRSGQEVVFDIDKIHNAIPVNIESNLIQPIIIITIVKDIWYQYKSEQKGQGITPLPFLSV